MKNLKIKANIIIFTLIVASYIIAPFVKTSANSYTISNQLNQIEGKENSILTQDTILKDSLLNNFNLNNWEEVALNLDKNGNGINDQFDYKLETSKKSSSSINSGPNEQISFIIQFPDNYEYSKSLSLFKNNGGTIKYKYKEAINGFSGIITYADFFLFCEQLRHNNIAFFIEEDVKVNANLYYVSRNMNLRPYTWNTLGYDGDNTSSIAILDTGIDDSHTFFPGGYLDKDYTKKIVGWNDTYTGPPLSNPEDKNGHGTHVAAIAAGEGSPRLDYKGRTVCSSGLNLDLVGELESPLLEGYYYTITVARFNVTSEGIIEIECQYTDFTFLDEMYAGVHLFRGNTEVNSTGETIYLNMDLNLTYNVSTNELGVYELEFRWYPDDRTFDGGVIDPDSRFRGVIHYPFDPPRFGCGDPWKGVAPDTRIVGVKVLSSSGSGASSSIIDGINWVINHKTDYNITIMSLSLGTANGSSVEAMVDAVNSAVEAGIVTVVAAGNLGPGADTIGSPGDAEKVITVAAMNNNDQITSYSSQGGTSYYKTTKKPDITAPGGSSYDLTMFSADSNDWDVDGAYTTDYYSNDTYSAQGTSMATPAVAGAASLLIEAMGGLPNWQYTEAEVLLVKSLLLMTATETVNWREENKDFTPTLDRGNKDIHEGYGRINIDAAIEAWIVNNLTDLIKSSGAIKVWLNTSQYDPYGKHAYGGYANLELGQEYTFNLTVPAGADYDLYLYNKTPHIYGDPIIIASSRSSIKGQDEVFNHTANYTGIHFIVVKAVGNPLPSGGDDDEDDKKTVTTIDLLTILIIVGIIALLAIIFVIILVKRSNRDDNYEFRADY